MRAKIVVVGGGYAGVIATQRMARAGANVTLVSAGDALVNRIRLHEVAAGRAPDVRPLAKLLAGTGAALQVARVRRVDRARRRLELDDGSALDADFVLLATGSMTDMGAVPGIVEHALTLDGACGALRVRAAAARGGRLVVCGGGPTAVEAAAELAESFGAALRVQLVTRGKILVSAGAAARAHALVALARLGVEVVEDTAIHAVERAAVVTSAGGLPFDSCLWAGGFVATPLARDSGLPVDARGQLAVDATLAVPGLPWLFAAGDAARPSGYAGAPTEMSCKCALPTGATAAASILATTAGRTPAPLRWGDSGMCISLGRRDAAVPWRRRDGGETARLFRGRFGALLKESICRYVTGSLALERHLRAYRWLPPARQLATAGAGVAS